MVDTARTKAAITALLADNSSGAISPQDLRDALESIVSPVAGGGFGAVDERFLHSYIYTPSTVTNYVWASGGVLLEAAADFTADGFYVFNLTGGPVEYDPGWIDPNPYADTETFWDCIFPANTTLVLPAGVYQWTFRINASPPCDAGGAYWTDLAMLGPPSAAGPVSVLNEGAVARDAHSHTGQPASEQIDPNDSTGGGILAVDTDGLHVVPYLSTEGYANGSNPQLLELALVRL